MTLLAGIDPKGIYVGRYWNDDAGGPSVVRVVGGTISDITSAAAPTVRDVFELPDPLGYVRAAPGLPVAPPRLLAPCDLQAIKACGVTFAASMLERVIEERAAGDPARAAALRNELADAIGGAIATLKPGSEAAMRVKDRLIAQGMWSQYLEVGIGPDAEVFTKAQPMSAVGHAMQVGLHPVSKWNNPEPEIVLAVNSRGEVRGVTLGNDVNLRDVEGRSALLLGKAKDNNASCAIGPFIRLLDDTYSMDGVRNAEVQLHVKGSDGFVLEGTSSMAQISRDPLDLVAQTMGAHHQYPDGFMLFLGTLFAPTQDRNTEGEGFTHHIGDRVRISCAGLGMLENTVALSTTCPPWTFGASHLMRNLAARGLLESTQSNLRKNEMTQFTGGCLCASVTYTCDIEPPLIMNCHCADCRKAMGAVHATTMFVPEDKVTIRGFPRTYNHGADSGSGMTKLFCENCGSQLFSKNTNRPGTLGIRAGSVDDISVIRPKMNIFTDSAVPTTPMDPQLPQHRKMPS